MKHLFALPLALAAASCAPMANPGRADGPTSEAALADALQGRVQAGPARSCVPQRDLGGNRSAGENAIIFASRVGSNLVYVNRPSAGCPRIGDGRAIKIRTPATQLCSGDIVEVFDPVTNHGFGGCALGDFTPYRRVRSGS